MQGNMLTELQLPKLEFKNQKNIITKKSSTLDYLFRDNNDCVKNCATKSLFYKTATTPSMVSDLTATVHTSEKQLATIHRQFILTKPSNLTDKTCTNDGTVLTSNSTVYKLPKNSPKFTGSPSGNAVAISNNSKTANDASKIKSISLKNSNFNIRISPVKKSNNFTETKSCNIVVLKSPKGKPGVHVKLDRDSRQISRGTSLLLNPNPGALKFLQKSNSSQSKEKPEAVTESVDSDHDFSPDEESRPFCVISEVIGNADAAFNGAFDSDKNFESSSPEEEVTLKETLGTKDEEAETDSSLVNNVRRVYGKALGSRLIAEEEESSALSDLHVNKENATETVETNGLSSCETEENDNPPPVKKCVPKILENRAGVGSKGKNQSEKIDADFSTSNLTEGNTTGVLEFETNISNNAEFIDHEECIVSLDATKQSESQLITPKKTNDITKIKGWRRKQFFVEKPTTVEFYRIGKRSKQRKIKIKNLIEKKVVPKAEEPGNAENAFTCDSLDEFLDGEVDLKIGYEIPHLYAELGIKLTSEEIFSKPNFSEKDFKEVENRYRVLVPPEKNVADLDEIDEESFITGKRPAEDDVKSLKFLKTEEGKKRSDKCMRKHAERIKSETKKIIKNGALENEQESGKESETMMDVLGQSATEETNRVKLESKLLGLVVYPGPRQALHPLVQRHMEKLRSYSTRIDKNWANFAASAVLTSDDQYKRRILPVYCCVKVNKNAEASHQENKKIVAADSSKEGCMEKEKKNSKSAKGGEEKIKLKECCVLMDKIDLMETHSPWCMEHHRYDCEPCGLLKTKFKNLKALTRGQKNSPEGKINNQNKEVAVLPQASFNVKIANLLARKLRVLKFKGDTLTSIDCLKKLVPDNVEFIKLNYVQESFHSAYVRIWYLKQVTPWTRSRAFLSFSETPPVPNAVSLKPNAFFVENLPKIISEIVSPNKVFSPNEYAILHCNGKVWEIHGSLNIVFDKSDKNIEQVFASLYLPELEELKKAAQNILKVKAVKWWILDLTQEFRLIEIKLGNIVSILSRNKLLEFARCDTRGFIPLRRHSKHRILGVFIIKPLLPFVLMGPYYLFETHNMTLKGECSTLPFMYYVKENVMKDAPLKFFINSVIKDVEQNNKVLDGLWFYDKMCLDNTSYIEVMTRRSGSSVQKKFPNIDIEHGYSLNSLTNCLPPGVTAEITKRKDGQEELKKISVYLYFDVFELGYLEGELQRDNSVIISHPLDRHTKVKSHKMGDWFVRTIRRRIEFIPKDIQIKWFVTRHIEDLRGRRPFNKFLLGGAHVLTKNGIYYLLEMSESKIEKLGLTKSEIAKAITENHIIRLALEMKNLASLLTDGSGEILTMEKLLATAIKQIKILETLGESLKKEKCEMETEKMNLTCSFLKTLSSCQMDDQLKLKMIKKVERFFLNQNGDLSEEFLGKLKEYRIGRKYFRRKPKYSQNTLKVEDEVNDDAAQSQQ